VLRTLLDAVAGWPAPLVLGAAFLLLLTESGTLVGLFLPGATTLVALGLWSSASGTPVALVCAVAAGATVGGALHGFLRGRRPASPRRLPGRLGPGIEQRTERARSWLAEHNGPGAWLLLPAGHWIAELRTLMPRLAGAAGVPPGIAVPAVVVSGSGWVTTVVTLSRALGPQVVDHAQWAAAVVLAAVLLVLLARRLPYHRRG
jgi:membrane-associated protein